MQKIPTLFVRNPEDRKHVLDEVTPGCGWVLEHRLNEEPKIRRAEG